MAVRCDPSIAAPGFWDLAVQHTKLAESQDLGNSQAGGALHPLNKPPKRPIIDQDFGEDVGQELEPLDSSRRLTYTADASKGPRGTGRLPLLKLCSDTCRSRMQTAQSPGLAQPHMKTARAAIRDHGFLWHSGPSMALEPHRS